MTIKNIATGKTYKITKANWSKLPANKQSLFQVVDSNDEEVKKEILVKKKARRIETDNQEEQNQQQ